MALPSKLYATAPQNQSMNKPFSTLLLLISTSLLSPALAQDQMEVWEAKVAYTLVLDQELVAEWGYAKAEDLLTTQRVLGKDFEYQEVSGSYLDFLQHFKHQTLKGLIPSYAATSFVTPELMLYTEEDLNEKLTGIDTNYCIDYDTGELIETTMRYDFKQHKNWQMGLVQEWFYNEEQHQLEAFPVYHTLNLKKPISMWTPAYATYPLMLFKHLPVSPNFSSDPAHLLHAPKTTWSGRISLYTEKTFKETVNFPSYYVARDCMEYPAVPTRWKKNPAIETMEYKVLKDVHQKGLGQRLVEAVLAGKLKVYKDEALNQPFQPGEFQKAMIQNDTVLDVNTEIEGEPVQVLISATIMPEEAKALRVYQTGNTILKAMN